MAQQHHPITPERINALHKIRDSISGIEAAPQRTRLIAAIQQLQHVSTFEASRFLDVYPVSVKVVDASSFKLFMLLGAPCLVG